MSNRSSELICINLESGRILNGFRRDSSNDTLGLQVRHVSIVDSTIDRHGRVISNPRRACSAERSIALGWSVTSVLWPLADASQVARPQFRHPHSGVAAAVTLDTRGPGAAAVRLPDILRASTARVVQSEGVPSGGNAGVRIAADVARAEVMEAHDREWLLASTGMPTWSLIAGSDGSVTCLDTLVPERTFVVFGRCSSAPRVAFAQSRTKHVVFSNEQVRPSADTRSLLGEQVHAAPDALQYGLTVQEGREFPEASSRHSEAASRVGASPGAGVACLSWMRVPE